MKKDKQELETKSLIIDYDKKNELFRNDEFYKDNDKECYLYFSWISQIIVIGYLFYIFLTKNVNYIVLIIIYVIYLYIQIIFHPWYKLIINIKSLNELMFDLFYSPINLYFESFEKKFFGCLESSKDQYEFPYYSYRDVSGLIVLKTSFFKKSAKYLPVKLYFNLYYADNITKKDYHEQIAKFTQKYIDNNIRFFKEKITCGNFHIQKDKEFELLLIKLDKSKFLSLFINIYMFLFFKIICLGKIYDLFFLHYVNEIKEYNPRESMIIIRKIFSTRNNLTTPENSKKYEKFNPCINYNGKLYYFDNNKIAYTLPNVIPIEPSESNESNDIYNQSSYINNYKSFEKLIEKAVKFESETKKENINIKADYLIKVDENKGQFSFYE